MWRRHQQAFERKALPAAYSSMCVKKIASWKTLSLNGIIEQIKLFFVLSYLSIKTG